MIGFALQNLLRLWCSILEIRAPGLFLTDCVKPSLWQRLDAACRLVIPLRQVALAQLNKYHHQSGKLV